MEILLALFIKVIEAVVVVMTKDLINHYKNKEQRKKTTLTPRKRNKGGNSKRL